MASTKTAKNKAPEQNGKLRGKIKIDKKTTIKLKDGTRRKTGRVEVNAVIRIENNIETIQTPEIPALKLKVVKRGKFPYTCNKCDAGFPSKADFDEHVRIHVLKKESPPIRKYTCDVCFKTFMKLSDKFRHIRVHTGEKPSVCNFCNKRFQQDYNLTKHLVTHLKIKPFHCEICQKQFARNDVLNRHVLTHTDDKPFSCPMCDKGFIRYTQLETHINHAHIRGKKLKFKQDVEEQNIKQEIVNVYE